jgi:hypothetical protein
MNQKTTFFILFTIALFVGIAGIYTFVKHPSYYPRIKNKIERTFAPSIKKTYSGSKKPIKNSPYSYHVNSGKKHGILLPSNQDIRTKIKQGKLIKVKNNPGYKVQKLNHSKDVLVQPSYLVLQEIGKRFHNDNKRKTLHCYFSNSLCGSTKEFNKN